MALKSLWPVYFIITSSGIPSRRALTTNVRLAQWVVMASHFKTYLSILSDPLNETRCRGSSICASIAQSLRYIFIFWLEMVGKIGLSKSWAFFCLYFSIIERENLFSSIRNGVHVFWVTIQIRSSRIPLHFTFSASEYRSPVNAQKQKTSRVCSHRIRTPILFEYWYWQMKQYSMTFPSYRDS